MLAAQQDVKLVRRRLAVGGKQNPLCRDASDVGRAIWPCALCQWCQDIAKAIGIGRHRHHKLIRGSADLADTIGAHSYNSE
eukprot:scaffold14203_cov47-Prasinocladus_malaysianus.AAC.1